MPNSPSSQAIDQCYDQGYGSERSPEDEVLPPLPLHEQQFGTMVDNSLPQGLMHSVVVNNGTQMFVEMDYGGQKFQQQQHYDFITEGRHNFSLPFMIVISFLGPSFEMNSCIDFLENCSFFCCRDEIELGKGVDYELHILDSSLYW